MPRRRPGQMRAALAQRRRHPGPGTSRISGLSPKVVAEIGRLEVTRSYLWPGMIAIAVRQWDGFVPNPYRRLWVDDDGGCGYWECCMDPWLARDFTEGVLLGMSRRRAREFRRFVDRLDVLY